MVLRLHVLLSVLLWYSLLAGACQASKYPVVIIPGVNAHVPSLTVR